MSDYGRHREGGFLWRDRDDERTHRRRSSMFGGDDERYVRRDDHDDRERGRRRGREEQDYGYDDRHEGLPIEETSRLIASNKVEGTPVYGRDGDRLGTIYNFMVDKRSGQVEYAVMSHGGFMAIAQRYYPLPWRILEYDTRERGYRIGMRQRDLEHAPSFRREDEPRFSRDYGRRVNAHYGLDY